MINRNQGLYFIKTPVGADNNQVTPRYNWGYKISEGTYGELIRVWDKKRKIFVCVKRIGCRLNRVVGGAAVILREILVLLHLQACPSIVQLLDVCIDGFALRGDNRWRDVELHDILTDVEIPFESVNLVFEDLCCDLLGFLNYDYEAILKGEDFVTLRGDVSMDVIKSFCYQILLALDFLHFHGYVHRDVKPQNILIDETGRLAKLADFGFARKSHFAQSFPITETRAADLYTEGVATLWYRPPEVICRAQTNDISLDIWSLGIVVYEMIAGIPPFCMEMSEIGILYDIFRKLGTPTSHYYLSLKLFSPDLPKWDMTDPRQYFTEDLRRRDPAIDPDLGSFIGSMLCLEPSERMTPREALRHPFLATVNLRYLQARQEGWCPWTDDFRIRKFHEDLRNSRVLPERIHNYIHPTNVTDAGIAVLDELGI